MTIREITNEAADKATGVTLAEVQRFVDDCYRAGLPVTTPVAVVLTWKNKVHKLTAKGETRAPP